MITAATALLVAFQATVAQPPAEPPPAAKPSLEEILSRVSEEAEAFQHLAPNVVGQEVLQHKSRKNPPRFRLRLGQPENQRPEVGYQTREIVSEYGYAALKEAPEALREFRQVVTVDGRKVLSREKARTTLATNMRANDDRVRRTMLQEFERHGMSGAATDFGQMLLLFRRGLLSNYDITLAGEAHVGADPVWLLHYKQKAGPDAMRVFQGGQMVVVLMEGGLVVRQSDSIPLRVTMKSALDEDGQKVEHKAEIEYAANKHGLLLPASVHYVKTADGVMMVENRYAYSDFKMFKVEAEIKFTFEDEPAAEPPKPAPPKK